jgi:predicted DsbA family dithiol-disulfide isomerase
VRQFEACDIDMVPDVPDPRELRAELAEEFAQSRRMGVASYPTLLFGTGHGVTAIPVSYDYMQLIVSMEETVGKAI